MSAVHAQTPVELAPPPLDETERMERQALHAALAEEERQIAAARRVSRPQRQRDLRGGPDAF